jgi:hypothetical protein
MGLELLSRKAAVEVDVITETSRIVKESHQRNSILTLGLISFCLNPLLQSLKSTK